VILGMAGKFISVAGEIIADLKRRDSATVDAELLKLKREKLSEALEQMRADVAKAVIQKKAQVQQDLVSRGLYNSTVLESMNRQVDQDAADETEKAAREYARDIEEIALMEQKVAVQNKPWWSKALNFFGIRRWG
jgi:multidrug efflux pump subunit AcrB